MNVLMGLFILAAAGIVADTIVKVAKARAAGAGSRVVRAELDDLAQQLGEQSALLADAQATIAAQSDSIQELHERLDFTERILAQAKERGLLAPGSGAGTGKPEPGR